MFKNDLFFVVTTHLVTLPGHIKHEKLYKVVICSHINEFVFQIMQKVANNKLLLKPERAVRPT